VTATRVLAVNGKDDEFGNPRDRDRVVACAKNGLGIALASMDVNRRNRAEFREFLSIQGIPGALLMAPGDHA
jgi:hypothetical protein